MTIDVPLDGYHYYPALRSRRAELEGLRELDMHRKRMILPIITLGEWPKALHFEQSLEAASEAMQDLPFIVDLTTDRSRLPDLREALTDDSNGFKAWRQFCSGVPHAIPTVLITETSRTRDVIRQATEIEAATGKVAFRIRDFMAETSKVIAALCALETPTNAIIFIDCQYIRNGVAAFATAAVATINAIRSEFPESIISILSTSFPASTLPFFGPDGESGSIEILEQDLFSRIGGRSVAIYGDHASIHSVVYDDIPGGIRRWSPRIDFPTYRTWQLERRRSDDNAAGYSAAARTIVDQHPDILSSTVWGDQKIVQAANGDVHAKGPAKWIAVRVNIHLARQIDRTADHAITGGPNEIGGGEDAEDFDEDI